MRVLKKDSEKCILETVGDCALAAGPGGIFLVPASRGPGTAAVNRGRLGQERAEVQETRVWASAQSLGVSQ